MSSSSGTVSNIFIIDEHNLWGVVTQIDEWVYKIAASGREVTSVATSPLMPATGGEGMHGGTLGFLVIVSWRSNPHTTTAEPSPFTSEEVSAVANAIAAVPVPESHSTGFLAVLEHPGDRPIQVIKIVRALTGLGLKEAKDIIDSTPRTLATGLSAEQARTLGSQLKEAGASYRITSG